MYIQVILFVAFLLFMEQSKPYERFTIESVVCLRDCHVPSYAKGTAHLFTKQSKSENSLIGTAAPRFFLRAVVPGPFFRLTTVVSKRVPEDHSIYRLDEL